MGKKRGDDRANEEVDGEPGSGVPTGQSGPEPVQGSPEAEEAAIEEAFQAEIDELKRRVAELGGTLPNPKEDPAFYERIEAILSDPLFASPKFNVSLKEIAKRLGVPYGLMKQRMSQFRRWRKREQERAEAEAEAPEQGAPGEESVLSDRMERVALRLILKRFANKADALAKEYIEDVVKVGQTFIKDYGSWCKEEGMEYEQCLRDAMEFYMANRDRVERFAMEALAWRVIAMALLRFASRNIVRVAALDVLRASLLELAERGRLDLVDVVYDLAQRIVSSA